VVECQFDRKKKSGIIKVGPAPCEVGELDKRGALVMRIEIYELQFRYKPTQSLGLHFVRKFINQTSDLWTDAATVVRAVREEKS
jgi:hypothetical protein